MTEILVKVMKILMKEQVKKIKFHQRLNILRLLLKKMIKTANNVKPIFKTFQVRKNSLSFPEVKIDKMKGKMV